MATRQNDDLHRELARTREERDYYKQLYEDLVELHEGMTDVFQTQLKLSPVHARLLTLLSSGRTYSTTQIMEHCGIASKKAAGVAIFYLRRVVPWVTIHSKQGSLSGYTLDKASVAKVRELLATFKPERVTARCRHKRAA
jgi:hypothetical protein